MCFGVNILAVGVKINCLLAIADASAKLKTLAQPARKYQATDMPEIIESAQVAMRSEVVRWTSQVTGTRSGGICGLSFQTRMRTARIKWST
jgi:hypothetical protein